MPRFVTILTYANKCKVSKQAIYKRLKSGTLSITPYCEGSYIDMEEYPPNKQRHKPPPPPVKRDLPDWVYA